MKLVIQKDQKSGLTGKTKYILEAKVELTNEESQNVKKYKVGKTVLYTNMEGASGLLGKLSTSSIGTELTVDSLLSGKTVEMKDFFEMIALEKIVKESCQNFKTMLDAMSNFGGDEIIEY